MPTASGLSLAQDSSVLHTIDEIHRLAANRLSERVAIDMECVVAYYSVDGQVLFLNDGLTGIYAGSQGNLTVKTGDRVRVRGVVGPGRFVIDYTIEPSDNQIELPPPKVASFQRLQDGNDDSQFVAIQGQLVSVQTDIGHTVLEMNAKEGGRFRAMIHGSLATVAEFKPLLGRQLRLLGTVGARFDTRGSLAGFQIWIGTRNQIEEIRGDGSESVPVTVIADLHKVPQIRGAASFFRVHGRMDYQISSSMILVHDSTGTLFVELSTPHQVNVGDCFEINGVLDAGIVPPILRFGELSALADDLPPAATAQRVKISELVADKLSGQIVSTRGEFVGPFSMGTGQGFLLQSEQHLLPVFLNDGQLQDVSTGTQVDVTGVWVQQRSLVGFNIGSCALYSRLEGIKIGSQFPWKLAVALTMAGLIALISLVWAVMLRRQVHVQKSEFEQQIVSIQKMESLGVLAGGIAHDFNNLLTVILGNAALIEHTERSRGLDKECVACIDQAASRAAELTQQMLAYAGRGRFDVRAMNLSDLISEMSSLLTASVPRSTHISFDLSSDLRAVMADVTQLRQVVMNLVLNGSESLNGLQGCVDVRTSFVQCSPVDLCDCLFSFVENSTTFVQLKVSDTGLGMEEETIERMFDPFFTTKFSGRGLGLSTVLGIVRGHKGSIRVTSTLGTGTCFEILLPVTEEPCSSVSGTVSQISQDQGTGKVLVIDDEQSVLALMCRTLEMAGLAVHGIESPVEALALFTDPNLNYDCVITDMTMPEMCGDELAQNIRRIRPNVPIILCSGFNVSDVGKGSNLAVSEFLKKPFSNRQLVELTLRLIAESCSSTSISHPRVQAVPPG